MSSYYKVLIILAIVAISFSWGVVTAVYRVFPYDFLESIRSNYNDEERYNSFVYSGVKDEELVALDEINSLYSKLCIIAIYGQSNAANSGQRGYQVDNPVFVVFNGTISKFSEPTLGATGSGGNFLGRLGDKLIDSGECDAVLFSNSSFAGVPIYDLANLEQSRNFIRQLKYITSLKLDIDYILFQHGEANHKNKAGHSDYFLNFATLRKKIRQVTEAPIYISKTSLCSPNASDQALLEVQERIANSYHDVYSGPNTDLLDSPAHRLPDGCHFSALGLDELAQGWFDTIVNY